jgi:hypothetical protein
MLERMVIMMMKTQIVGDKIKNLEMPRELKMVLHRNRGIIKM